MTWFVFTLICIVGWGIADLFYKKSNQTGDRYSHLKTTVWVGLMMGTVSMIFTLLTLCKDPLFAFLKRQPLSEWALSSVSSFLHFVSAENLFTTKASFFVSAVKYLPASLSYIISMTIGYAGMRYLEVSIISPIQNASGALSAVSMLIHLALIGRIGSFWDDHGAMDTVGTILIITGVITLGIVEHRLADAEEVMKIPKAERKYRFGALALIFPVLYCVFDTVGTAADGIILGASHGLGLGKIDVIILYGFTFLLAGFLSWTFLLFREKKAYNPFCRGEIKTRGVAALFEQFGQIFYVYAMADNPVIAAPMIASYCIVSTILSRIFLKEKMTGSQYACIAAVFAGVLLLGISEGLSEV